VSEPTAVFAVGEFAGAVGDKRRSEDRKSVVPALEFSILFFTQTNKKLFSEIGKVLQLSHDKIPREI